MSEDPPYHTEFIWWRADQFLICLIFLLLTGEGTLSEKIPHIFFYPSLRYQVVSISKQCTGISIGDMHWVWYVESCIIYASFWKLSHFIREMFQILISKLYSDVKNHSLFQSWKILMLIENHLPTIEYIIQS